MTGTKRFPRPTPAHRAPGRPAWTPRPARVAARVAATVAVLSLPPAADPYATPRWLVAVWSVALVALGAVLALGGAFL